MGHITTIIGNVFETRVCALFRPRVGGEGDMVAMELLCLEQAQLCQLPESRAALEEMARNYRAAMNCK